MKQFFEKINQLSFPAVFFIASFLTLVSILPLWLYISQQETQSTARAAKTLAVPTIKPRPSTGPVPTNPPTITRAYPWVGKPGDIIIIEGKNFGTYPTNSRISIGGQIVPDALISSWTDTRIEAVIPNNPKQGEPVTLRIDTHPIAESIPLVFYDKTTKVRLQKQGTVVTVTGFSGTIHATLYTTNGKKESTINLPADATHQALQAGDQRSTILFTLSPSEDIQSLILTDDKGTIIPYSINPTEFGF